MVANNNAFELMDNLVQRERRELLSDVHMSCTDSYNDELLRHTFLMPIDF